MVNLTHYFRSYSYRYSSFAFLLSIVFIWWHGYLFNTGDQAEHLPQVYAMLDPTLYPNDFFLSLYNQTFTVREYWVWLVYGVAIAIGVETGCFMLYLVCVYLTIYAWMLITRHITENAFAPFIVPVLLFFIFNSFTVGGNTLLVNSFVGTIPAEALASWAILFGLKNSPYKSAILLGIAGLFQLLVGLHVFILISIVQLTFVTNSRSFFKFVKQYLVFGLVVSPMALPIFYRQLFVPVSSEDLSVFYQTLYYQRAPWHYIPSLFSIKDYLRLIGLALLGLIAIRKLRSNARLYEIKITGIVIIFGCLLYEIALEWLGISSVGKWQWFKTTVWLNALSCVLIGGAIAQFAGLKEQVSRKGRLWNIVFLVSGMTGLLWLTQTEILLPEKISNRYQIGNYKKTDLQKMHAWISDSTSKQSCFLIPPDNESFGCEAKRATPVNYKALVHEAFYFKAWREGMERYYKVDFEAVGNNPVLPIAVSNYYAYPINSTMDIEYQLCNQKLMKHQWNKPNIVHQEGIWVLLKK